MVREAWMVVFETPQYLLGSRRKNTILRKWTAHCATWCGTAAGSCFVHQSPSNKVHEFFVLFMTILGTIYAEIDKKGKMIM